MADITYRRHSETVFDGQANGLRGQLIIKDDKWHSIERLDGFKWLRPDTYECEFRMWTNKEGKRSQAIRVLGSYSNGRIYIHPANKPVELSGCIAPGKSTFNEGVGDSRNALKEIFSALGGYVEGKKLTLKVIGVIPSTFELNVKEELEPGSYEAAEYEDVPEELLINE